MWKSQGVHLWVDDFVAGLVEDGEQLLMHGGLLGVGCGGAHHARDAGGQVHHLPG